MEWVIGLIIFFVLYLIDLGSSSSSSKTKEQTNERRERAYTKRNPSPYRKQLDQLKVSTPVVKPYKGLKTATPSIDKQQEKQLIAKLRRLDAAKISTERPVTPKSEYYIPTEQAETASNVKWITGREVYSTNKDVRPNSIDSDKLTKPVSADVVNLSPRVERIIKEFNAHGIKSLWHMTHRDNIPTILEKGILCHSAAYNILQPRDISFESVQHWRTRIDPIHRKPLHDYAPTYINIRNPMLFVKKDINRELCLIEISLSVLNESKFIFTDGNAAAKNTQLFNSFFDVNKLPWDVLQAEYWNDFIDGKRKRCAEVLVYPAIKPEFITRIHCCSDETLNYLQSLGRKAVKSQRLFY